MRLKTGTWFGKAPTTFFIFCSETTAVELKLIFLEWGTMHKKWNKMGTGTRVVGLRGKSSVESERLKALKPEGEIRFES